MRITDHTVRLAPPFAQTSHKHRVAVEAAAEAAEADRAADAIAAAIAAAAPMGEMAVPLPPLPFEMAATAATGGLLLSAPSPAAGAGAGGAFDQADDQSLLPLQLPSPVPQFTYTDGGSAALMMPLPPAAQQAQAAAGPVLGRFVPIPTTMMEGLQVHVADGGATAAAAGGGGGGEVSGCGGCTWVCSACHNNWSSYLPPPSQQQQNQQQPPPPSANEPPSSEEMEVEEEAVEVGPDGAVLVLKDEKGLFPCPFCKKAYKLPKSCRHHIQRHHPGRKCHVLKKPGRTLGLIGEARAEHVRRRNREANQRYHAKLRAQKRYSTAARAQEMPIPPPPQHLPPDSSSPPPPAPPPASEPGTDGAKENVRPPPAALVDGGSGGGGESASAAGTGVGATDPASSESPSAAATTQQQGGKANKKKRPRTITTAAAAAAAASSSVAAATALMPSPLGLRLPTPPSEGEALRAAFGDLVGLVMQQGPQLQEGHDGDEEEEETHARCLEAFDLLWSKEPAVFAAAEAHLSAHPLPGPPDGMEPTARLERVQAFLDAVAPSLPSAPAPAAPQVQAPLQQPLSPLVAVADADGGAGGGVFAVPLGMPPVAGAGVEMV